MTNSPNNIGLLGNMRLQLSMLLNTLKLAAQVRKERAQLADLDDRTLKDIGVTRFDATFEAGRSNFDIPDWRIQMAGIEENSTLPTQELVSTIFSQPAHSNN